MLKISPLNDQVLVRMVVREEKSAGGIYLPSNDLESYSEGIVEALLAGGVENLAINEKVIFSRNAGTDIKIGQEKYKLVPFTELLGKFMEVDKIPE